MDVALGTSEIRRSASGSSSAPTASAASLGSVFMEPRDLKVGLREVSILSCLKLGPAVRRLGVVVCWAPLVCSGDVLDMSVASDEDGILASSDMYDQIVGYIRENAFLFGLVIIELTVKCAGCTRNSSSTS
ncbi:hypothetical protein KCU70_g423, partial [Aureobasidium melanogenum]